MIKGINAQKVGLALYNKLGSVVLTLVCIVMFLWLRHVSVVFFNAAMISISTSIMAASGRHIWNLKNPDDKVETNFFEQFFKAVVITGAITFYACMLVYTFNSQVDQRWPEFIYITRLYSFAVYALNAVIALSVVWFMEKSYYKKQLENSADALMLVGGVILSIGVLQQIL